MAKKYVPSGYQILSITINDDDGTPVVTKGKNELVKYLQNIKKPLLITIGDADYKGETFFAISTSCSQESHSFQVISGTTLYDISLYGDDDVAIEISDLAIQE